MEDLGVNERIILPRILRNRMDVKLIQLAHDRDLWQTFVNMEPNLWVP
jgi:hypothetical protein